MTAEELVKKVKSEDWYSLLTSAARLWAAKQYPEAAHIAVYVFHPGDTPPVRITIPVSASEAVPAH